MRGQLSQFGFHWNNARKCWQHPCGQFATEGSGADPRQKYGSRFAADLKRRLIHPGRGPRGSRPLPLHEHEQSTENTAEPFGPVIYQYTRSQAIADGFQIEVTKTAAEAGIRFPVFITRGVYEQCVAVPPGVTGQDEAGRLWDVVWMLRFAIIRSQPGTSRLTVALYVRNSDSHPRPPDQVDRHRWRGGH